MKQFVCFLCLSIFLVSCQTAKKRNRFANDHLNIAVSLIKECDYRRAVTNLLKAVSFSKKDPLLRHTLASAYFLMGEYLLAEKEYKKALAIKKDFTEVRVNLARSYIERGFPDKSLQELERAEKDITYTDYIKLVGTKGLAFFKKADYKKAGKWFMEMKTLAKRDQDKCFVFLHLGRMELAQGNLDSAEKYLIKALAQCQKTPPLCQKPKFEEQYFLAETYRRKKDLARAEYQLRIFINRTDESNPYRQKALNQLEVLKKTRQLKKKKGTP